MKKNDWALLALEHLRNIDIFRLKGEHYDLLTIAKQICAWHSLCTYMGRVQARAVQNGTSLCV